MKKILLLSYIAATAFTAQAQRKGLWVTPHAAVGGGNMVNIQSQSIPVNSQFSIMFTGGADVNYMITDNIGFGCGIGGGAYGAYWKIAGIPEEQPAGFTFAHVSLDIPVYFRYVSGKGGSGFFVNTGFINHFFLKGTIQYESNFNEEEPEDANYLYSSFGLSPFVYLGANIRCGNRVQINVGPQIQYQATNNFAEAKVFKGNHLNIALKLGVGIHAYKTKNK